MIYHGSIWLGSSKGLGPRSGPVNRPLRGLDIWKGRPLRGPNRRYAALERELNIEHPRLTILFLENEKKKNSASKTKWSRKSRTTRICTFSYQFSLITWLIYDVIMRSWKKREKSRQSENKDIGKRAENEKIENIPESGWFSKKNTRTKFHFKF